MAPESRLPAPPLPRERRAGRVPGPRPRSRRWRARPPCRRAAPVPGRRRRAAPATRKPRPTMSAPTPAGPPSLWAETETRSAPSAGKSTGIWPMAAQASTWTATPRSRQRATTSATGWTVPPRGWRAGIDKDRAALTGEELVERREVDPPEPVDRDRRDRPSPGGREPDRRVLDGGAGDGRGGITLACRPVRPVRRLGPAGGEHDLARGDVDKVGDGFPGTLDVGGCEATLLVDTTRIGEGARRQPLGHRRRRLGPQRARRGVVEVVPGHAWLPGDARADRSPRAREDSCTGTSSPQSPASSPFTMSAVDGAEDGVSRTTSPNGQCSRRPGGARRRSRCGRRTRGR